MIEQVFYIQQRGGKDTLVWYDSEHGLQFVTGAHDGALVDFVGHYSPYWPNFRWYRVSDEHVYEAPHEDSPTVSRYHARGLMDLLRMPSTQG